MRILFLTDEVPYPANSGAPLRTFNLLKRLADEHEVWLVAFCKTEEQQAGAALLRTFCQGVEVIYATQRYRIFDRPIQWLQFLCQGKPPDFRFFYDEALVKKLMALTTTIDFDLVQIDQTPMGIYLDALPQRLHAKTLWMVHDVDFKRFARIAQIETNLGRKLRLQLHSFMLRIWEPRHAARFARCITVSETDQATLLAVNPTLQVAVVANGVDAKGNQPFTPAGANPVLLFVGNMNARPNVDAMLYFCRDIFPKVQTALPEVELWIVGMNPLDEIKQLQGKQIRVIGYVEDIREYYQRGLIALAPLRAGGGTRLKILEAMAFGRPVVTTAIGAEGLLVQDGVHLCIANTADDFAKKIIQLVQNPAFYQTLAENARQLVLAQYDWDIIARRLSQIYAETTMPATVTLGKDL